MSTTPFAARDRHIYRVAVGRVLEGIREYLRRGELEVERGICCETARPRHAAERAAELPRGLVLVTEPEPDGHLFPA